MIGKYAVILQNYDAKLRPSDVCFDRMSIWARILNLPFGWMNAKKGEKAARSIGTVEKIDVNEKGKASGSFLRARVAMEINKPLRRGLFLRDEEKKANVWYDIQYEKLPFYCKSCGLMGHSELDCPTPALRGANGKLPYDIDLRAPDDSLKKKLASFGETASEMFSAGSFTSRANGRSRSSGKAKGMSSGESTDHVEKGEEMSSPLKERNDSSQEGKGNSMAANKLGVDSDNAQQQQKRKPTTSADASGGGSSDLNLQPEGSNALVPAGFVNTMLNQLRDSSGSQGGVDGLKKPRRSNTNARSAAAARTQPRQAQ